MNKILTNYINCIRNVFWVEKLRNFILVKKIVQLWNKNSERKKVKWLHEKFPQYEIGRGTYGNPHIRTWNENATLKIGAFCSIATGVQIFLGGEHRTDWVTTYPFSVFWENGRHLTGHPKTKGDVVIGNDVWIGSEAVVLSGVKIGDGAVIGARSFVTRNIEPYSIYGGNPARLIKKRFDDATIQRLLKLEWWKLSDEKIEKILPLLLSTDIQAFITKAEQI
jgi:chloramphenicol O-acetyltransferase type B